MITDTPKKTGPSINRGGSTQTYETPPEFMNPLQRRFGKIAVDLAAEPKTAQAERYFTKEDDALQQHWCTLTG